MDPTAQVEQQSNKAHWFARLTSHIPPRQFGLYIVVGFVNTLFGYGTYALLTAILSPHVPLAYMVSGFIVNPVNITFSYFNYKIFIFKTKGHYLREWFRCVIVYSTGGLLGLLVLPVLVVTLTHVFGLAHSAPYVAGAILTGANVIVSFLGHKNFSFAPAIPIDGTEP